jgi:putative aminopeptidase FrvX
MTIPPLLAELLRTPGPSGGEDAVSAIVRREAAALGAEVEVDALGSTVARVRGSVGGRLLAVFAHVDQIGVGVTHVTDDGLLRVRPLASWSAADAVGHRMTVVAREGAVPAVVTRAGERKATWADIRLDVGAATREQALALVAPGDAAVLVGEPVELAGNRVGSAALDDRAGVYAALEGLRRLAADLPSWDVALVATVQEESGSHGGAAAAARRLAPDVALVVDVTYADDATGGQAAWGEVALGAGPTVFRGPVASPLVADRLIAAGRAAGFELRVETGKVTNSDSDDIFTASGGTATGLLSIPLRYMHTASEVAQLDDLDSTSSVIEAFARALEPGASFVR